MERTLLLCLLLAFVCADVVCGESSNTDESAKKLIEQLADDSFEVRSAAEAKLISSGKAVMPAIQAATKTGDPESRSRAARILVEIEWNEGTKGEIEWLAAQGPTFGAKVPGSRKAKADASEGVEYKAPAPNGEVEDNIRLALDWLSRNQEADGHWDSQKFGAETNADIEQTALAMLAFLATGSSDRLGQYKDQVTRASEWLIKQQQNDGLIGRKGEPDNLTHAIAGMALAEMYSLNQQSKAKDPARKAIDYSIEKLQSSKNGEKSGFGRVPRSDKPDLLTTTLFLMQFKSAKIAAMTVDTEAFDGLVNFIDSINRKAEGPFAFTAGQFPSPKATTLGLLSRTFLGWKRDELAPGVLKIFETMRTEANAEHGDVLMNYLGGIILYNYGGGRWALNIDEGYRQLWVEYRTSAFNKMKEQQRKEGNAKGSWDPKGPWAGAGRVFSTALKAMSLSFW